MAHSQFDDAFSDISPFRLRLSRLQQELAQFENRCLETRLALNSHTNASKEHVSLLQVQLFQSDQVVAAVKPHLWGLEQEVSHLQADQVELQLQLELERANHARDEEQWALEREELGAQVALLQTELSLADNSDGELDFLITPVKHGHFDRPLSSSGPMNGLSLQTLLDMGEASLEVEEDVHELKMRLEGYEARERTALHDLALKDELLQDLRLQITQLKEEVAAEKDKAKDEAEDLTQEMAELRYQLMEMVEQERELRAQTEQASVLRVVELESQVKSAREEVVQALASRREAEMQSDRRDLEMQRMRLAIENADHELKHIKAKLSRTQEEVDQARQDISSASEARLKLEKQLVEAQVTRDSLVSENQQLKASLDRAVATTNELAGSLRDKEAALHDLIAKQMGDLNKDGGETEISSEDLSAEQLKNRQHSSHEHEEIQSDVQDEQDDIQEDAQDEQDDIQEDVQDEQVESDEGSSPKYSLASDQEGAQFEEPRSPTPPSKSLDSEVSSNPGANQRNYDSRTMFLNEPVAQSEGHTFAAVMELPVPG